ncbi:MULTISPECIES: oligopeptide/dipeptide ABC transporter ATP-binding protein [unclassified Sulfitobacter]|uniref:oligopeptide/dipeptide ABC transporter ATP-binding protein n=1 Tax=unclassified Sulfitobacter TaxID=196795 RepID=UPI0020CEDE9D|nr:oligopeptide/dipeptide ABC transporter ATP-binding protein [Sulfitobacter sp. HGT1]
MNRRKSQGSARAMQVKGNPPSPINPLKGSAFATRCPKARDRCRQEKPALQNRNDHGGTCSYLG